MLADCRAIYRTENRARTRAKTKTRAKARGISRASVNYRAINEVNFLEDS